MKRTKKKEQLKQELLQSQSFRTMMKWLQVLEIDTGGRDLNDAMGDYLVYNECDPNIKVLGLNEEHYRECDECGRLMIEGYCIDDGAEHYCSEECLCKNMTMEEFDAMYDEGRGTSYWTSWVD